MQNVSQPERNKKERTLLRERRRTGPIKQLSTVAWRWVRSCKLLERKKPNQLPNHKKLVNLNTFSKA